MPVLWLQMVHVSVAHKELDVVHGILQRMHGIVLEDASHLFCCPGILVVIQGKKDFLPGKEKGKLTGKFLLNAHIELTVRFHP